MNEETMKNEYELSPAEEAELDRLLRETAEADNKEVDFDAIHDAVLKKAREKGIYVFPAKKAAKRPAAKKSGLARSIWTGAAAAAAVFVIGFTLFAVLNGINGNSSNNKTAYGESNDSAVKHGDAVVTKAPETSVPEESFEPAFTPDTVMTLAPVTPTADAARITLETPLPTEYPMRGGVAGYTLLAPFTVNAEEPAELLPELLPEIRELTSSDEELTITAAGENEGRDWCYKCRVLSSDSEEADTSLGVSVARYTTDFAGIIRYVWRVSEDSWLEITLIGFEREAIDEMLLSIPLCDCEAVAEAA